MYVFDFIIEWAHAQHTKYISEMLQFPFKVQCQCRWDKTPLRQHEGKGHNVRFCLSLFKFYDSVECMIR